jgi:hypothetical protein
MKFLLQRFRQQLLWPNASDKLLFTL